MANLSGKIIVVTGASSGIGAALARKFVEHGAKVVGLARRVERMETMAKELEKQPGKLYPIKADLAIEDDILKAFKWTTENVGPLEILINNAGILKGGKLINGDTEKWKMIFDLNVTAVAIACREAIKIMQANNIDGYIINVNSTTGHTVPSFDFLNMYPASKHALRVYTESLRRELAKEKSNIRVSSISPGAVATDIFRVGEAITEEVIKENSLNMTEMTLLACEDVVQAVTYMLSTTPKAHVTELMIRSVRELD